MEIGRVVRGVKQLLERQLKHHHLQEAKDTGQLAASFMNLKNKRLLHKYKDTHTCTHLLLLFSTADLICTLALHSCLPQYSCTLIKHDLYAQSTLHYYARENSTIIITARGCQ